MGRTAREKKPRALGGGRSERYESRRVARKAERAYAPSWSDAAAAAVLDQLHKESAREGKQIVEYTRTVLTSAARAKRGRGEGDELGSLEKRSAAARYMG